MANPATKRTAEKSVITNTILIQMDLNKAANSKKDADKEQPEFTEKAEKPKPVAFSYRMLDIPELNVSPAKDTIARDITSENPYFTDTAKYPDSLWNKNKRELLNFFFNKTEFESVMSKEGTDWLDLSKSDEDNKTAKKDNEIHNAMLMLNCLFQIDPAINRSIESTYDRYILEKSPNLWNTIDVKESVNFFGWMEKFNLLNPERGIRLKIDGTTKVVSELQWTNDVVHHPEYLFFLKTYNTELKNIGSRGPAVDRELSIKINGGKRKELMKQLITIAKNDHTIKTLLETVPDDVYTTLKPSFKPQDLKAYNKHRILSSISADELKSALKKLDDKKQLTSDQKNILNGFDVLKKNKSFLTFQYVLSYSIDPKHIQETRSELSDTKRVAIQNIISLLNDIQTFVDKIPTNNKNVELSEADVDSVADLIYKIAIAIDSSTGAVGYQDHADFFKKDDLSKKQFSVTTLSLQIAALKMVKDFVDKSIAMNLTDKRPDGTDKTAAEKKVDEYAKKNDAVSKTSDNISDAIKSVYSERKSSNQYLYNIIEKTKNGTWNNTATEGAAPINNDEFEQQREAFTRIYDKYILGKPQNVDIYQIRKCLYTGVDTLLQKNGIKEIYVQANLLDANNVKKNKSAKCIQKDDSLTNLLKYLLYYDTDAPLNRLFRDYRLAEKYVETSPETTNTEKENTEKTKDKVKKENDKAKKGGRNSFKINQTKNPRRKTFKKRI